MAHDTSLETVGDLVRTWQTVEPTSPRLTWYGPDGERVELSGRVLANWVVKATNLLTEEVDAGPGVTVAVDLPVHWRGLVWSLAVLRAGAALVLPTASGAAAGSAPARPAVEAAITTDPAHARVRAGGSVIAVALPALARSVDGPLPAGVIDGAADLMTHPDVLMGEPDLDRGAPALDGVTHAELFAWARRTASGAGTTPADVPPSPGTAAGRRALVSTDEVPTMLAAALTLWSGHGSLVLVGGQRSAADLAHLARVEAATG